MSDLSTTSSGHGAAHPDTKGALVIREATLADAPALREYAARLFAEDLPGIFRRPVPTVAEEADYLKSRLEPPNSTVLVALVDSVPVGLADIAGATLPEEAHSGTFGISVDREWRGHGVGSRLLEEIVRWASTNGVSRVQGYAWDNNPRALRLYERLGFEREGTLRRAIIRDGQAIDVVLVAKLVDCADPAGR